jgi:hypothetical protein
VSDPWIVERAELLSAIEELELLNAALQDVDAGVSKHQIGKLRKLRLRVQEAQPPAQNEKFWEIVFEILKAIAAELVKMFIETLNCYLAARCSRSGINEDWKTHQRASPCRWINAAGIGGQSGHFRVDVVACGGG